MRPALFFTTEAPINNTGTPQSSVAVSRSWYPGGRIGSLGGITPLEGSGSTDGDGVLAVPALPLGSGLMLVAHRNTGAADDDVYYQAGSLT